MNMQNLMAQAKKLQSDMERITKEINEKVFSYESSGVKLEMKGNNEIATFNITDVTLLEDKEMLEDIVVVAFNNVLNQIKKEKDEKLGKFTGGLGGMF